MKSLTNLVSLLRLMKAGDIDEEDAIILIMIPAARCQQWDSSSIIDGKMLVPSTFSSRNPSELYAEIAASSISVFAA